MEEKRDLSEFNGRMNQWVSSQGILFQLQYGSSGSSFISSLFTLTLRLAAVAVLVFVVLWIWALKKGGGDSGLAERFEETLAMHFEASEVEVKTVRRRKGRISVDTISLTGGPDAFYEQMEIRGLSCDRTRLGDLKGEWNAGKISISGFDVLIRSGSDSDEQAKRRMATLLKKIDDISFDSIDVTECNIAWGYGTYTRGAITGAKMTVNAREPGIVSLEIKDGLMSQNWIRQAALDSVSVTCTSAGVRFSGGKVNLSPGELTFSGNVSVAAIPQLSGRFGFQSVPVSQFIPVKSGLGRHFQGQLQGEGTLGGSPNSVSGITTGGHVALTKEFPLIVRASFPLIQAIRAIDTKNTYYKVNFSEGEFSFDYEAGELAIQSLDLVSPNLMKVSGEFDIRKPSDEEVAEAIGVDVDVVTREEAEIDFDDQFSLRAAGKTAFKDIFGDLKNPDKSKSKSQISLDPTDSRTVTSEKMRSIKSESRIVGDAVIHLQKDVFADVPLLRKRFDLNVNTGFVEVDLKMNEPLNQATVEFSNTMIQDARVRLQR